VYVLPEDKPEMVVVWDVPPVFEKVLFIEE
jgi:hypothetical protein